MTTRKSSVVTHEQLLDTLTTQHKTSLPAVKASRSGLRKALEGEDEFRAADDTVAIDEEVQVQAGANPATAAEPLLLAQAEANTATDGVAGSTDSAAVTAATEGAAGAAAATTTYGGLSPWAWGGIALGGAALAAGGGGGGGDGSGAPAPAENAVAVSVVGGPVIANNGLTVVLFKADGITKIGEAKLDATGRITVKVGDYTGVVIAHVIDAGNGADYLDESTGTAKDLNAELYAAGVITAAGSTLTLNINPLTTLAYHEAAQLAGSGALTAGPVNTVNAAIADAFGLPDLHTTTVVTTNGSTTYNAADGLSAGETYGAVLAALSGADQNNGGNSQTTINNLVAGTTIAGGSATLSGDLQQEIVGGIETSQVNEGGQIYALIDKEPVPQWAEPITWLEAIGESNKDDYRPRMAATTADGAFVAVWYGTDAEGDTSIFVQRFSPAGRPEGEPVRIEPAGKTNGQDVIPEVTALGSSGAFVVTWLGADSSGDYRVFVQKFQSDGTAVGSPQGFGPTGVAQGNYAYPQIAQIDGTGAFAVVWSGSDVEGDSSIHVQRFDALGGAVGTTRSIETNGVSSLEDIHPQIVALGQGRFAAAWQGQDIDGDFSIQVQSFDASGNPAGAATTHEAPVVTNRSDIEVRLAALNGQGDFAAVWQGVDSDGDYSIFVRRFDQAGTPYGNTALQIEPIGVVNGYDRTPSIAAIGTQGAFVISWVGHNLDGISQIFLQRFDAAGLPIGQPATVDSPSSHTDRFPQVAAVGDQGAFAVTWQGKDSSGDASIFVQNFDASGQATGTPMHFEPPAAPAGIDQRPTIIATGTDGAFAVAWQGTDSQGDQSIFVQRFGTSGMPTPSIPVAHVGVSSNEAGTAYLVQDGLNVASVSALTSLADHQWNSIALTTDGAIGALPLAGLADGVYALYAADAAGNLGGPAEKRFILDTQAPPSPVISALATDDVINLGETALIVSGTAEAGAIVSVSIGPSEGRQIVADPQGAWSLRYLAGEVLLLPQGDLTIQATATDAHGNESAATTRQVLLDTISGAPQLALANDTGARNNDGLTRDGTVLVSGLEPGGRWEYSLNGGVDWLAGTGDRFAVQQAGATEVRVRQIDAAGNTSNVARLALTLDQTAPAPVLGLKSDTGQSAADLVSANGAVTVSGLEAGARWEYSTDTGASWTTGTGLSFVLQSQGNRHVLTRQTDQAGNASAVGELTFQFDQQAPTVQHTGGGTVQSSESGIGYLVQQSISVSTVADIARAPDGQWNSIAIGNAGQNYTVDQAGLQDGVYRLFAADVAGNLSAPATLTVSVDHTAPAAPQVQSDIGADGMLHGRAEADADVTVNFGFMNAWTVPVGNDGHWAYTLTQTQLDALQQTGTSTAISATATDAAGNVSAPTSTAISLLPDGGTPGGFSVTPGEILGVYRSDIAFHQDNLSYVQGDVARTYSWNGNLVLPFGGGASGQQGSLNFLLDDGSGTPMADFNLGDIAPLFAQNSISFGGYSTGNLAFDFNLQCDLPGVYEVVEDAGATLGFDPATYLNAEASLTIDPTTFNLANSNLTFGIAGSYTPGNLDFAYAVSSELAPRWDSGNFLIDTRLAGSANATNFDSILGNFTSKFTLTPNLDITGGIHANGSFRADMPGIDPINLALFDEGGLNLDFADLSSREYTLFDVDLAKAGQIADDALPDALFPDLAGKDLNSGRFDATGRIFDFDVNYPSLTQLANAPENSDIQRTTGTDGLEDISANFNPWEPGQDLFQASLDLDDLIGSFYAPVRFSDLHANYANITALDYAKSSAAGQYVFDQLAKIDGFGEAFDDRYYEDPRMDLDGDGKPDGYGLFKVDDFFDATKQASTTFIDTDGVLGLSLGDFHIPFKDNPTDLSIEFDATLLSMNLMSGVSPVVKMSIDVQDVLFTMTVTSGDDTSFQREFTGRLGDAVSFGALPDNIGQINVDMAYTLDALLSADLVADFNLGGSVKALGLDGRVLGQDIPDINVPGLPNTEIDGKNYAIGIENPSLFSPEMNLFHLGDFALDLPTMRTSYQITVGEFAEVPPEPTTTYTLGQSVIDLGEYGKLINPVKVDGEHWYYVWDMNGDGAHNGTADATGKWNYDGLVTNANGIGYQLDYATHDVLDAIFTKDIDGNANPGIDTTDTYRYVTLNGVRLALPTINGGEVYPNEYYQLGTQIDNTPAGEINSTYSEMLAVWDGNNGDTVATGLSGAPIGWTATGDYWTATAPGFSHAALYLGNGGTFSLSDSGDAYVALEVLLPNSNDTTAPAFTSGASAITAENIGPATVVYSAQASGAGSVAYSIGGNDGSLFNLDPTTGAVTFKTSPDFEAPADSNGDNVYDFTITATDAALNSASQNVAISVTDVNETSLAGQSVIDLGGYGNLIAPVQVEGHWYYFWDRSGDGTSANTGSLNGGVDYTTHNVLDGLFTLDINGAIVGGVNTNDTYRYATLNGVKVALPTASGGAGYPGGIGNYQNGTAVTDGATNNPTYDDLLAIWDAHNGAGTGTDINGTPAGWRAWTYWSATPSASGHAIVDLLNGSVYDGTDNSGGLNVALEVM